MPTNYTYNMIINNFYSSMITITYYKKIYTIHQTGSTCTHISSWSTAPVYPSEYTQCLQHYHQSYHHIWFQTHYCSISLQVLHWYTFHLVDEFDQSMDHPKLWSSLWDDLYKRKFAINMISISIHLHIHLLIILILTTINSDCHIHITCTRDNNITLKNDLIVIICTVNISYRNFTNRSKSVWIYYTITCQFHGCLDIVSESLIKVDVKNVVSANSWNVYNYTLMQDWLKVFWRMDFIPFIHKYKSGIFNSSLLSIWKFFLLLHGSYMQ